MIQGPAPVIRLVSAQVGGDLDLQPRIDLAHKVHHHDVLGRDGAVGLELELPAPLLALQADEGCARGADRAIDRGELSQLRKLIRCTRCACPPGSGGERCEARALGGSLHRAAVGAQRHARPVRRRAA